MKSTIHQPLSDLPQVATADISVPKLIGQIYESAPLTMRARIIEQLMRPLGVLGLMAVANGIFAGIRLRDHSVGARVALEDATAILPSDVVALADWAQQVSTDAIDGMMKLISSSPVLAGSTAAVILVSILMRHSSEAKVSREA